jgi:uncharacterized protein YciI
MSGAPRGQHAVVHWMLTYELVEDHAERLEALQPEHLAIAAAAHGRDELLFAGFAGEPVSRAFQVFQCDELATVQAFVTEDPYVRDGLVTSWRIDPWHVVIGAST